MRAVVVSLVAPSLALGLAPDRPARTRARGGFRVPPGRRGRVGRRGDLGGDRAARCSASWPSTTSSPNPSTPSASSNRDDVVALVVFFVVALLVGWVVARAVSERDRATRREREARLLNLFATKALSGEPLDGVLNDLAAALVDALRLASCAIRAHAAGRTYEVRRTRPGTTDGLAVEVAISSGDVGFGTLTASHAVAREELAPEDRRLLEAAASQIAVDLERASFDAEIAAARLDAERSQARAALFSSVTHDLRTPLASIKTAVTSLLQVERAVRPDAGPGAPADGARGDRPAEPAGRQHPRARAGALRRAATGEGAHGARRDRRGRPAPPRAHVRRASGSGRSSATPQTSRSTRS